MSHSWHRAWETLGMSCEDSDACALCHVNEVTSAQRLRGGLDGPGGPEPALQAEGCNPSPREGRWGLEGPSSPEPGVISSISLCGGAPPTPRGPGSTGSRVGTHVEQRELVSSRGGWGALGLSHTGLLPTCTFMTNQ